MFGLIAETIGWEWVFHVTSVFGVVWYVFWLYLVYDSPHDHPRISEEEKKYIKTSLGKSAARHKVSCVSNYDFDRVINSYVPTLTS